LMSVKTSTAEDASRADNIKEINSPDVLEEGKKTSGQSNRSSQGKKSNSEDEIPSKASKSGGSAEFSKVSFKHNRPNRDKGGSIIGSNETSFQDKEGACGCFLDEDEEKMTFPNWHHKKIIKSSCSCLRPEMPEGWESKYRVLASGYVEMPHGHLGRVDIMGLEEMLPQQLFQTQKPRKSKRHKSKAKPEPEPEPITDAESVVSSRPRSRSRDQASYAPSIRTNRTKTTLGTQIVRVKIPESMHGANKRHGFHDSKSTRTTVKSNRSNRTDKHRHKRRPHAPRPRAITSFATVPAPSVKKETEN